MADKYPLVLNVEATGGTADGFIDRFNGYKGTHFLRQTLLAAGITTGRFTYRLTEWFKSSGFTKPVQPRKHDAHSVSLWLKPGGNGSAVKGTLTVDDRVAWKAKDVFDRLKEYVETQEKGAAAKTAASLARLDDAAAELLLLAVNEVGTTFHATRGDFDRAVIEHLRTNSYEADGASLPLMYRDLIGRGMAEDTLLGVKITPDGQKWLDDPGRGVGEAPALPPPLPEQPTLPPEPPSAADLIEKHRAKLERLLILPGLIRASEQRQNDLEAQIEKLLAGLEAEKENTNALRAEIDTDALRLLLEGK